MPKKAVQPQQYSSVITRIFEKHYEDGMTEFEFSREEFESAAKKAKVELPKNLGDVIYAYRHRRGLPDAITKTAPRGKEWIIVGAGRSKYKFQLAQTSRILPAENRVAIKVPDATPEIIARYSLTDEQALLARVRYNRLIDIFLGITTYPLQSHLRTSIGTGQIEIDEVYVGLNKSGCHFVIPVQAKRGSDKHGVVQVRQDLAWCAEKFPDLVPRAIAVQFVNPSRSNSRIAMFELTESDGEIAVLEERHYELVPANEISDADLKRYKGSSAD